MATERPTVVEVPAEQMIREFSLEGAFLHPSPMPPCLLNSSSRNVKTLRVIVLARQKLLCSKRLGLLKRVPPLDLLEDIESNKLWAAFKTFYSRISNISDERDILDLFIDLDRIRGGASFDLDALLTSQMSLCR